MTEPLAKPNKFILTISFLVLILGWAEVLFFWKNIPPQIPWFYSMPWGEAQLMNKTGLFAVMGVASVVSFISSFAAKWTKRDDIVIEKAVFITILVANVLLFLNLTKILMIFAMQ